MASCASDQCLTRLLEDQVEDDRAQASLIEHVETCARCQERLKELTGEDLRPFAWGHFGRYLADPWSTTIVADPDTPLPTDSLSRGSSRSTDGRTDDSTTAADFPEVHGYEILAVLGHGGMGVVYRARQQRLRRAVALKMIRAGNLAKPEDLARFRIEAETVAKLRHANIVQIYDIGEMGGIPFVTLELLEGGSLAELVAGTPQPGVAAATTLATLARAMHFAHQAGIIHRDLKPTNVLFSADGIPKITDFGLAKRLNENGHTESGQVLGSPSYIPPEQADGRSKEVGPAADVYALGAILYEMLTGRPPFKGATPVETVMQVLHTDPAPPSRLSSQVSRDLETICLKCLAKEPRKRYGSAEALAEDLERYLAHRPVRARRTPFWERAVKWVRRRPTTFSLLAVACAISTILVAAGLRSRAERHGRVRDEKERIAALRVASEQSLNEARDGLSVGRLAIEDLSRLETTTKSEPRLADLHFRALELLDQARRRHDDQQARAAAKDRYHEFFRRRDDAFFQDTELTGLDRSENVRMVRQSSLAALAVFAASGRPDDSWTLGSLPASLTEHERSQVALGCYEMMMVLAEAIAQTLPGESAGRQARKAP